MYMCVYIFNYLQTYKMYVVSCEITCCECGVFIMLQKYISYITNFQISINMRKVYLCFHLIPMCCDKHILKQNWFLSTNSINSSVTTGKPSSRTPVALWTDQYLVWSCKFFGKRQEETKNMAGGLETVWIFYCTPSLP